MSITWHIVLPIPPSTNNLFTNKGRGGRRKSDGYEAWIAQAGYQPLAGRWHRLSEDPDNELHWTLDLKITGLKKGRDTSNVIKPVEDLIVKMTGLKDEYDDDIHACRWVPGPGEGAIVPAVYVTVTILGVGDVASTEQDRRVAPGRAV